MTRDSFGELPLTRAAVVALGLLAALAVAYGAGTGKPVAALLAVGAVGGLLLVAQPNVVLWLTLSVGLVVAGVAKLYVPQAQEIRWAAVPLALLLGGYSILASLQVDRREEGSQGFPPLLWCAVGVVVVVITTTLANAPEPMQLVRGLKGYFQVWGLVIGLALLPWPDTLMRRRLPVALLAVALLQLPFVAHQYLVLVPYREALNIQGMVPADVIGGTFGAEAEGGGSNAMLALFMFVVLAGLCGLWQRGMLSGGMLMLFSIPLLLPLLLNQAKASVLYVFVLFMVLFGRDIIARPGRFLAVSVLMAVVLGGMLTAYSLGVGGSSGVGGWAELVAETYEANVAADFENRGSFTRMGALRYWADQHIPGDLFGALLGHGVYEARTGSEGAGALWDAADRSLGIKNTAISAMLWDTGLIGLLSVLALMAVAYSTAGRLSRLYCDDPWLSGLFWGARGAVALFALSLTLKSYFTYHLAYQTMFALLIGWLAFWDRRARSL